MHTNEIHTHAPQEIHDDVDAPMPFFVVPPPKGGEVEPDGYYRTQCKDEDRFVRVFKGH